MPPSAPMPSSTAPAIHLFLGDRLVRKAPTALPSVARGRGAASCSRRGACLRRRGRRGRGLLGEQVGDGYLIAVADIKDLLHLRVAPSTFPFAHRLAGDLQLLGELLLCQSVAAPYRCQPITECHMLVPPFLWCRQCTGHSDGLVYHVQVAFPADFLPVPRILQVYIPHYNLFGPGNATRNLGCAAMA